MSEEKSPEEVEWEHATRSGRRWSIAKLVGFIVVAVTVGMFGYVLTHLGGWYRF
jgi:hypothetical protein